MNSQKHLAGQKIAVIGAGAVGSTIAYTAMLRNLSSQVVLVDTNILKEEGEVMDIDDALCFVETGSVRCASFKEAADADIIVITAGVAQKLGETRMDLVAKNRQIVKSIFKSIGKIKPSAIVIMVCNPVDVMTDVAQECSGLPRAQVFGSGTSLDTARLRTAVANQFGIYTSNVDGYVMGEHGDSEFVAWSTVSAGGISATALGLTSQQMKLTEMNVRNAAYEIINRKGATFFGIAVVVADIIEAILFDQHKILPLSVRVENYLGVSGVCISVPAVLGRGGVEKFWPVKLSAAEKNKFQKSAAAIEKYL